MVFQKAYITRIRDPFPVRAIPTILSCYGRDKICKISTPSVEGFRAACFYWRAMSHTTVGLELCVDGMPGTVSRLNRLVNIDFEL